MAMKILYVADDRRAAQLAARALRAVAPNATLTWARDVAPAMRWVQDNRDAAAIILEPQVHGQNCAAVVNHVKALGIGAPVIAFVASGVSAGDLLADHKVETLEGLAGVLARTLPGARGTRVDEMRQAGPRLAELERRVSDEVTKRTTLEQALSAAEATAKAAHDRRLAELTRAAEELAETKAQHHAAMARAARVCRGLEDKIGALETTLRETEQGRRTESAASVDLLTKRHAEFTAALAQAAQARDALARQLGAANAALDEVRVRRTNEAAAAAGMLAQRDADLETARAENATKQASLEAARAEAARSAEEASRREAELTATIADADAERARLERALADAEAAHASEVIAASEALADRDADLDAARAETAATNATLEKARADAASRSDEAARREAELGATLAQSVAERARLERGLSDAEAAHRETRDRATANEAAAAARSARLQQLLDEEMTARRDTDRARARAEGEAAGTRRRLLGVAAAHRRRGRDMQARLEAQLHRERSQHQQTLGSRDESIQQLEVQVESLQRSLATSQQERQRLDDTLTEERTEFERSRDAAEANLRRVSADYHEAQLSLTQIRTAFATLEAVSSGHASERARLETVLAERDTQLSAEAARYEELHAMLEESGREIAQLRQKVDVRSRELQAANSRIEALESDARQIPLLLEDLEQNRRQARAHYDRAPWAMARCEVDGSISDANPALVRLLGYRSVDELRKIEFAKTVFESAADVRWFSERAQSESAEPLQTIWRRKDGRRVIVRLQLNTAPQGAVDIIVEDITSLRTLEDRLRRSQRIEAVGRVASEVAASCDSLLRDVSLGAQRWIGALQPDSDARREGEFVLDEVTRAAKLLRQLAAYSEDQSKPVEPVAVQGILRDLEPVLRRMAGDDVELALPASEAQDLEVDVEAARVERILVNASRYARERMPHGGRVQIALAPAFCGSRVLAKHPNARPGEHVLITVTGVRRDAETVEHSLTRPNADLGALLQLVDTCGGHVWMSAERAGDMTIKIHLPRRTREKASAAPAMPQVVAQSGRSLRKWFRN
jgi:PAS domain S-box-containing protein